MKCLEPILQVLRRFRRDERGMIVEFILAIMMLLGFIVFSTIFGRAFSERNRMLAANRTMAWLYTHRNPDDLLADGTPVKTFDSMATDGTLADLLAEWHCGNRSVVEIQHDESCEKEGIFIGNSDYSEKIKDYGENLMNNKFSGSSVDNDNNGIPDKDEIQSLQSDTKEDNNDDEAPGFADMTTTLLSGFINFITSDFKHYHAKVSVGMPLVFGKEALAIFWGENAVQQVQSFGSNVSTNAKTFNGRPIAFIRPDFAGACVMPVLAPGGADSDSLGGMGENFGEIMDKMDQLNDSMDNPPKYRPYTNYPDDAGEHEALFGPPKEPKTYFNPNPEKYPAPEDINDSHAMMALMMFELDYPDRAHWDTGFLGIGTDTYKLDRVKGR